MTHDPKQAEPGITYLLKDAFSNRALVRDNGEKWKGDINGKPSPEWNPYVEYSAFEAMKRERDELKAENQKLVDMNQKLVDENQRLKNIVLISESATGIIHQSTKIQELKQKLAVAVEALKFYSKSECAACAEEHGYELKKDATIYDDGEKAKEALSKIETKKERQ